MTKILYVEDNPDNVYMLKMRLERKGYDVVIADNGQQGVELASREQPALILMDVSLPLMDGYEATRKLKSNPHTATIPVIMLTAHAMASDREKALEAGADEYEVKPIRFEQLMTKIQQLTA
ncbi:MAG: response regulator [Gammaproteobacteria bacterium]